jgi:hypothetical protein
VSFTLKQQTQERKMEFSKSTAKYNYFQEQASREMESMIIKQMLAILNEFFSQVTSSTSEEETETTDGESDEKSKRKKEETMKKQKKKRIYLMVMQFVFKGIFRSVLTLLILHSVRNAGSLMEYVKNGMKWLLYKKMMITDSHFLQGLQKYVITPSNQSKVLPIVLNEIPTPPSSVLAAAAAGSGSVSSYSSSSSVGSIEYVPILHDETIQILEENAIQTKKLEAQKLPIIRDLLQKDKIFQALDMFPSNNYTKFHSILETFFNVVKTTGLHSVCGISIDGPPGLGKSRSCDFIAKKCIYDQIYYLNLSLPEYQMIDFKKIVNQILAIPNDRGTTIVYIDEFDKYLAHVIKISFMKSASASASSSSKSTSTRKAAADTASSFAQYESIVKEMILSEVLRLFETRSFHSGIVFVFCSNHFNTIFQNVDMTHFNSLKDRFTSITYEPCRKEEIQRYFRYFELKLGHPFGEEKEKLLETIRDDIEITFRWLFHLHVQAGYDLSTVIKLINQNPKEKKGKVKESEKGKVKESEKEKVKEKEKEKEPAEDEEEKETETETKTEKEKEKEKEPAEDEEEIEEDEDENSICPSPFYQQYQHKIISSPFGKEKTKCSLKIAERAMKLIQEGDLESLRQMLDSDQIGINALFSGKQGGHYSLITFLLSRSSSSSGSPLPPTQITEFVKMFLDYEPDINIPFGKAAFYYAYCNSFYSVMELLLENEYTREQVDFFTYITDFMHSPSKTSFDLFTKTNFDFKTVSIDNETLLYVASSMNANSLSINHWIEYLLSRGVNPNHVNEDGTVLHYIVKENKSSTAFQTLLKHVDLSLCDSDGLTVKELINKMGLQSTYAISS